MKNTLVVGSWLLVTALACAGDTRPWELYAIKEDRTELNDLSKTHPEKVSELSELWEKRNAEIPISPPLPENENS